MDQEGLNLLHMAYCLGPHERDGINGMLNSLRGEKNKIGVELQSSYFIGNCLST